MMKESEKISRLGIILNSSLFIAKFIVGLFSNSIALISDALNSFTDIFSSIIVFIAVKVSNKKSDQDHPFGHHRAEPIAGIVIAIFTGILGFEIAKTSIIRLFTEHENNIGYLAVFILLVNIFVKIFMAKYFLSKGKIMRRPAIVASGMDSRNDVLVSLVALSGVTGSLFGFHKLDDIAALLISLFIFYFGYQIAIVNIDYLMGKSPSKKFIDKIITMSKTISGVKGINDVRAHYIGNKINIEIHIEVDSEISTRKSHNIGKKVQEKIERLRDIEKAFVHIDPI